MKARRTQTPLQGMPPLLHRRMWQDPRFSSGAAQRWAELRAGPWSDATIDRMFGETTAQVRDAWQWDSLQCARPALKFTFKPLGLVTSGEDDQACCAQLPSGTQWYRPVPLPTRTDQACGAAQL